MKSDYPIVENIKCENLGSESIIIFCTTPDQKTAQKIAQNLVENHLAACCNILNEVKSVFNWQGKVQIENECLMIVKSVSDKFKQIEKMIIELHPYEIPEIIATDISLGSANYLNWIKENIRF